MKTVTYPRIGETLRWERLPNGLPICVVHKPGYVRKYAFLATRYGGMDLRFCRDGRWIETPAGIAHYLEHKLFDTEDGNAMQELAKGGAEPNAFTGSAMTAYYFDCTQQFEANLRLLLSFVAVPWFTDESVEKERGIIAQEIGMVEDDPEWQLYHRLMEALYQNNPVRQAVAGSVESIQKITAQTLYDCHRTFYTPSNMCLVVVGDVDAETVLRVAGEVLPPESGPQLLRDYGREDMLPQQRHVSGEMEIALPSFLMGFKCPPVPEGEEQLKQDILGDLTCELLLGESSPLFSRLYSRGLINGSFDFAYDLIPGAAYVLCGGDSKEPEAVWDAVLEEVQRLLRQGVDEELFHRLRRAGFGAAVKGLNSFEAIAASLAEGCFHGYDPFRFPELYDAISPRDVLDFLRDKLRPECMAMSVLYPRH